MALEGALQDFSINDIISLVSLGQQTGTAEINGKLNGRPVSGCLYFKKGQLVGADLLDFPAREAALTFFLLDEGYFTFVPGEIPDGPGIGLSNEMIIMQGISQAEQWQAVRQLVRPDSVPALAVLPPGLAEGLSFSPLEWRVLTGFNGRDDLAALRVSTGLPDTTLMQLTAELVKAGVVELKPPNLQLVIYPELAELTLNLLGTGSDNLVVEAYRQAGYSEDAALDFDRANEIIAAFRKLLALAAGPGRAERLAQAMRELVKTLYRR